MPTCPARGWTNSPPRASCSPRAHATAPLCSPSRGSLFTGRYPQSNGLIGLAHHGWEYRADVRTLPAVLPNQVGTQHFSACSTRRRTRRGSASTSSTCPTPICEYVVEQATRWLSDPPKEPFLLTAGFFETHRPYPHDRYEPADADGVDVPTTCPTPPTSAQDLADFYGSIAVADAAVGQLLDTLGRHGTRPHHLGGVRDRSRTGASRGRSPRCTTRAPASRSSSGHPAAPTSRTRSTTSCSAVSTWFRRCSTCSASTFPERSKGSRTQDNCCQKPRAADPVRTEVFTTKTYHDSFDPIRAIRTKEYSYIENYARAAACSTCRGTSPTARPAGRSNR